MDRTRGLTLVELLVATGIFLVLGGALAMFLRMGLDTWRVGEMRREAYERAQSILDFVETDLLATFSDPTKGTGGVVDVLLLADRDPNARQRLRFVRTLAGEMRHPVTQQAGSLTGAQFDVDYVDDTSDMELGMLRAPGGLQEVAYLMDPDPSSLMVWRGVRSPIGGPATLFDEGNLYRPNDRGEVQVSRYLLPLADGVLHLEFGFWGQDTESWLDGDAGGSRLRQGWWDSTRSLLQPRPEDRGSAAYYDPASRHEPRDDVFPERVHVLLVLRPARVTRFARLTRPLGADDTEVGLNTTTHYPEGAYPFVKIGDEWIRYQTRTQRALLGCERGQRGTQPAEHATGTPVIYGTTFSRVIRVPGARASLWGQR